MEANILNMAANFESTRINNEELRIVMVGKTGVGKSATGNTILGRHCFESVFSEKSMTTHCAKGTAVVDGQKVSVIDTPGLFDTRFGKDKTSQSQCIAFASPGPHVFLVVVRLGRFTEEEKQTVQKIQEIFGESANRYSMVLFTGGDELEGTTEEFLRGSPSLLDLVAKCNGQYHVFDNKSRDRTQVKELLQKIKHVAQKNGGSHYTNEMFQEAERTIEKKKQLILKEKEEKIRREREEMEREIQRKYQEEMEKFQAVIARERKEREEEQKRERQEMNEERKREMEEMHEERRRAREEKQREMTMVMDQMREQHERQMNEERRRFQAPTARLIDLSNQPECSLS